jgi:hypothetical protein
LYRVPESGIGESDVAYEAAKRRDEAEWRKRMVAAGVIDDASAKALHEEEEEAASSRASGGAPATGSSSRSDAPSHSPSPAAAAPAVSLSATAYAALGALEDFSPPLGALKKALRRHDEIEKEFLKDFSAEIAAGDTAAARKRAVKLQEFLTRAFIELDGTKVKTEVERAARKATLAALHGLSDRIRAQTPDEVIASA